MCAKELRGCAPGKISRCSAVISLRIHLRTFVDQQFGDIEATAVGADDASIATGSGEVILVPATSYSTDTGAFRVTHSFYQFKEGKLVEIPMDAVPPPGD